MKRAFLIGFAACAFALAPAMSASAMPVASPDAISISEGNVVQVKSGHGGAHGRGHMGRAVADITMVVRAAAIMVGDRSVSVAALSGGHFYFIPQPSENGPTW